MEGTLISTRFTELFGKSTIRSMENSMAKAAVSEALMRVADAAFR